MCLNHGAQAASDAIYFLTNLSRAMKITCVLEHSTAASLIRESASTIVRGQALGIFATKMIQGGKSASWVLSAVMVLVFTIPRLVLLPKK